MLWPADLAGVPHVKGCLVNKHGDNYLIATTMAFSSRPYTGPSLRVRTHPDYAKYLEELEAAVHRLHTVRMAEPGAEVVDRQVLEAWLDSLYSAVVSTKVIAAPDS